MDDFKINVSPLLPTLDINKFLHPSDGNIKPIKLRSVDEKLKKLFKETQDQRYNVSRRNNSFVLKNSVIKIEEGFNIRDIDWEHVDNLAASYKQGIYRYRAFSGC
jgi:hypothetical protein